MTLLRGKCLGYLTPLTRNPQFSSVKVDVVTTLDLHPGTTQTRRWPCSRPSSVPATHTKVSDWILIVPAMMQADHQISGRSDPARLEKQREAEHGSTALSSHQPDAPYGIERPTVSDDRNLLCEEEAIQHARQHPDDEQPIFLTYSFNDTDNPRNWPAWRKWYITCFVSMLNVLTYVRSLHHSVKDCLTKGDR